jgi:ParB family transcriptional regulator, chromosome partitioning protein
LRIPASSPAKHKAGVVDDLVTAVEALKDMSWTEVNALKGDVELIARIEEAQKLLDSLKTSISFEPGRSNTS